ncbi:MAG: alpha/beta hydrolase [bacterium]|nr:alpha/beta hydrolase [bacterium]
MLQLFLILIFTAAAFAKDPLPRRAWFGAQLAPATSELLAASSKKFETGVALPNVFPGSSAAEGGIMSGDILLTANGLPLRGPQDVGPLLKKEGAGADIVFEVLRADKVMSKIVHLKEAPRETSDEFEIIYDAANIDGYLRRIILTKPKGDGPFPTVVLMGGLGCYSVDVAPQQPFAYRDILYNFTRNGFATVRIEKTGMGDSQGEPCAQQSFFDETHGLTEGIKSLDRFRWIDKSKMIYFGHSMGGLTSPVVYQDIPARES